MTKIAIATILASAGLASADVNLESVDRSGYETYTAAATEIGTQMRGAPSTQYDNIGPGPGGYVAFPPSPDSPLGVADYQSVATNNIAMDEFQFVGGVDTIGGTVFFDFFDAGGNFVDGFAVSLSMSGNFIWTITLGGAFEASAGGFTTANGQWFLGNDAALVGDALGEDVGGGFNFNFAISGTEVPAPGALALVGMGGLFAARRRR